MDAVPEWVALVGIPPWDGEWEAPRYRALVHGSGLGCFRAEAIWMLGGLMAAW